MLTEQQIDEHARRLIRVLRTLSALPMEGKMNWTHVPAVLLQSVRLLSQYRNIENTDKKRICIRALQILCPDDNIDELIPPFVDMVWGLVKRQMQGGGCCCRCLGS